jgi:hypothetical protein
VRDKRPAADRVERLIHRLAARDFAVLSPVERRLLDISHAYFSDVLLLLRLQGLEPHQFAASRVEPGHVMAAARMALMAAVEIEPHLRDVREGVGGGHTAGGGAR